MTLMHEATADERENEEESDELIQEEEQVAAPDQAVHKSRWPVVLGVIVIAFIAVGFLIRPGVFTVQPIGAIPDGVTVIYHSRNPDKPFFSSPDGLCLEIQGSVTLLCRASALSAAAELMDREILRLPYIKWAYLQSTGVREFDR